MPNFSQGDVVRVPFPYTDRATRQSRPALVVSSGASTLDHSLLWVSMITSAANKGWAGDLDIADLQRAGLPAASVIRTAKIATIDAEDASRLGRIPARLLKQVILLLSRELDAGPR